MDEINRKYLAVAAKLGDIEFQIALLNMRKAEAVQEIHELNNAMKVLKDSERAKAAQGQLSAVTAKNEAEDKKA